MKTTPRHGDLKPDSVVGRLERLYADAPHEWFTMADLALKLSTTEESIHSAIRYLRRDGRMTIRPVMVYARVDEC